MSADPFELWSTDLFDREAAPTNEGHYPRLDSALRTLWRLVLDQGIQDDGKPTFTDFQLRIQGKPPVSIPRDPSRNRELALLRTLRHKFDFEGELARIHAPLIDQPFDFGPFLDELTPGIPATIRKLAAVLGTALSITEPFRRDRLEWQAGAAGPHMRIGTSGYHADPSGYVGGNIWWTLDLLGLQFEGKPVRFRISLEQHDYAGESWRVEADDSPAALPLRDALLSAGFSIARG